MRYVVLLDGTRIENCNDGTTSNSIFAVRDSYEEAGAVRDLFTKENAKVIKVFAPAEKEGEEDKEMCVGSDLVLLDGASISVSEDKFVCTISTRNKTNEEKMQEEISELQDVVLG